MIAVRYRTTVSAIVRASKIKNPNLIYPGQRLKIPIKCQEPLPTPGPWKGQYWNNRDLSGNPKFTQYDKAVSFHWGKGGPKGLGTDNFSVRWTRTRHFDAGKYLFDIKVDDGVRLLVDGELLIDAWRDQGPTHYTVEKELAAGNHKLQVDYYEHTGGAQITLAIEYLGEPSPGPWTGKYFNNIKLQGPAIWTTSHKQIGFDWGNKSPKSGVSADFFSARWIGEFTFEAAKYRFYATVDDGIRIYVDDTLVLDEWHDTSRRTYSVDIDLQQGKHTVKVEYYERTGDAVAKAWWTKQ
jgi:LysM repeat protein